MFDEVTQPNNDTASQPRQDLSHCDCAIKGVDAIVKASDLNTVKGLVFPNVTTAGEFRRFKDKRVRIIGGTPWMTSSSNCVGKLVSSS